MTAAPEDKPAIPHVSPESGIFPERFSFGSFEWTKVDVIHRLAGRSGEAGGKIPGKTGSRDGGKVSPRLFSWMLLNQKGKQ